MYTQVVVLTYQPPEIDSYTYKIPKELEKQIKVGQLVEVSFGSRQPFGIVIATSDTRQVTRDKIELKSINKIISPQPILLPYQIELLKWLSFYYMAPMVNCLEAILPELPSKQLSVHSSQKEKNKTINRQPLTVNQTLVLVPSINRLPETMAKFKNAKNYAIYHNELKTSERFIAWMKILSGQVDYVFGSRSAIFAPCPKLSKIIIFDEHDGTYKDERSPYFNTLTVAEKIKELSKCQLEIVDNSPKITTYFNHHSNIKSQKAKTKTKIVSMQDERLAGNKSPISNLLEEYLIYAAKNNKRVLLFLNKKKDSGHLFCKSCKQATFAPKMPQKCPNCQSPDFFFNSLNIVTLAEQVKKILPKSPIKLVADTIQLSNHPTIQISQFDIATATIFYKPLIIKYDLIAHIFVDSLIGIADFATDEKLFCQIVDLKSLLAPTGLLLIQTYNPNNPTLNLIIQNDYQKFYKNQIDLRRKLHYPPFALLVKLKLKGNSEEKVAKEAETLAQKLNQSIVSGQMSSIRRAQDDPKLIEGSIVSVLGPYKSIFWQRQPSYNIIIRHKINDYSLQSRENAINNLAKILEIVNRKWQVTVEPESIN